MDDYEDIWDRHRVEALLANAESMMRKYGDAVSVVAVKERLKHKGLDDDPQQSRLHRSLDRRSHRGQRGRPVVVVNPEESK